MQQNKNQIGRPRGSLFFRAERLTATWLRGKGGKGRIEEGEEEEESGHV